MRRRDQARSTGSVSAELVVGAVPVTLLLTMFLLVCGRLASARIAVDAAAAAGARAAAAAASTPQSAAVAASAAVDANSRSTGSCTTTADTSAFRPGGQVTVHVECAIPLSGLGFTGPARVVRATATEPIDTYRSLP